MKKIILIPVLLLVCALFFTACKKTSGSPTSSAIGGTWEAKSSHLVQIDSTYIPATSTTTDSNYVHGHTDVFVFNSNNSFTETDYTTVPPTSIAVGTYSLNATLGNITFVSPTVNETDQYKIAGDSLTISEILSAPGIGSDSVSILFIKQ
jgi:hypothetical protein